MIETVADEFEEDEETVEADIQNIGQWLHRLDVFRHVQGIALLAELRENRRKLHQMAETVHEREGYTEERKIRSEINRSINMERHLADSTLRVAKGSHKYEDLLEEMA